MTATCKSSSAEGRPPTLPYRHVVREVWRGDIEGVLKIARECLPGELTAADLDNYLINSAVQVLVAETELCGHTGLSGFIIARNLPQHVQLHLLAVRSDLRRLHVGRLLVSAITGDLSISRRRRCSVYVRESQLEAQLLFRTCGFRAKVPIVADYFDNPSEDAYRMELKVKELEV